MRKRVLVLVLIGVAGGLVSAALFVAGIAGGSVALIVVPSVLFPLFIVALVVVGALIGVMKARNLRQTGREAIGTVVRISGTSIRVNNEPVSRIHLRVRPADGSPSFEASIDRRASLLKWPKPGDAYTLRYDPEHPERIALTTNAPLKREQADAAAQAAASEPASPFAAPAPLVEEPVDLARIEALHSSGALTDAEYENLKRRATQ